MNVKKSATCLVIFCLPPLASLLFADSARAQLKDLALPPKAHLNPDPAFTWSVIAPANAEHRRNSVASMIQRKDGSVMIAYDDYGPAKPGERAAHDFFPSKIVSRISPDGGKTWSDLRVLMEPKPGDFTIQAPGLLKLASGEILLTFVRVYQGIETGVELDPGVTKSTMALYRSKDDGETFVEEKPVWQRVGELRYQGGAPWNLQLKSGRILLAFHAAARQYGARYTIGVAVSDDDGRTWKVLNKRVVLSDGQGVEPSVAELADGSLLMAMRTEKNTQKKIYLSRSTDGGETWSRAVPSGLKNPSSVTCLKRIPGTKDLLIVFNNSDVCTKHGRTPMSAALSSDGGRTWRIVGDIVFGKGIELGPAGVIFPSKDTVLLAFTWIIPPDTRTRVPIGAVVIDREWFYRKS
ncbi:MAG: sialidase family protein [Pirellulales bacterium]